MKRHTVYLASASPRRQQLLEQVNVAYTVIKPEVDESQPGDPDPQVYTQGLAISKALDAQTKILQNVADRLPIIAADTAVFVASQILGKPKNFENAREMLSLLSGCTHEVYSSICVIHGDSKEILTQVSLVTFRKITEAEIISYWKSGEPQDKAGAYAIQGQAAQFIANLSGSYSGVMGLPLYELMRLLAKINQPSSTLI